MSPLEVDLAEKLSNLQVGIPIEDLYDDGVAAKKIVTIMKSYLG